MSDDVIIALITAGFPMLTTAIATISLKTQANKHSTRQSILQLILEDKISVMEGKLPENHQAILAEYDEYQKNGGNSYVHKKIDEYNEWLAKVEENFNKEK